MNLNYITETVCRATGTTKEEIQSTSRAPRLVFARTLITHHARRNGYSLQTLCYLLHRTDAAILNYKKIYTRLSYRDKEFIGYMNMVTVIIYS